MTDNQPLTTKVVSGFFHVIHHVIHISLYIYFAQFNYFVKKAFQLDQNLVFIHTFFRPPAPANPAKKLV